MNVGYVFLIVMAGMAYFVTGIPTPDEMQANFQSAQKFYTSGAYDQALEAYQEVADVESRFLEEEEVIVEFANLTIPIQDASIYKMGSTYMKMIEIENENAENAETDELKEKSKRLILEYAQKATEYFDLTQEQTKIDDLKAQSQNSVVNSWYEVLDYDRVILEGQELIDKYPESLYVLDAMYNIGWAYYDKKEYDKSIETYNLLLARFPTAGYKSDRALFQIGESYYDQALYAEAIPFYQRLVDKMRITELTDEEIRRIQRDKLAGISDETALDLAAKSQLKVGACYANEGDFDAAAAAYRHVAEIFKFDQGLVSESYQRMADMYYDRGDFDSSIQAYRDAIDEVPDKIFSAKMQVLICQRYFDEGRYEDSVREYNHYINAYSDVAFRANFDVDEAFLMLARSYYELGSQQLKAAENESGNSNLELALTTFDRLVEQFPGTTLMERIYFYKGLTLQREGSDPYLEQSITLLNNLLSEFPETPYEEYVYFFIARSYQGLNQYSSAIEWYQKIIDEYPESLYRDSAYMEMAIAYKNMGQEESSLPEYLSVGRSDKKLYTTARLLASQYQYTNRNYDDVVTIVTEAVQDTSAISDNYRLSQLFIMRGNANKNLENFEEAIVDYTLAYDLQDPQTQEMASVYRAGVYIDLEQYARAEADLKELMTSQNEEVKQNAQIRLAFISLNQGKQEQALQTYLDLYNEANNDEDKLTYLRNLIQLSYSGKQWQRVEQYCNMMLDLDIAEGKKVEGQDFYYKEEAYFNLVLSSEQQNEYVKARDYLIEGYKVFPKSYFSSDMLIKLGTYYLTVEEMRTLPDAIDIAADYFNEYLTNFPNTSYSEMAHYYLGFCYYNGRRFDEAYEAFSSFAQQYPNSEFTPEAIFYYADCQYNLGDMEAAVDGFTIVINNYPRHEKAPESIYTMAWALMDLGREAEAITALNKLVDEYPESEFSPSSLFSVADYYYNEQQYQEAMDSYQKVLDNYPESEVAAKVPDTLKELKELIAYLEYEKGYVLFAQARENNDDLNLYRQAAEIFESVATEYPYTESEIGAYSNMGMCYEALELWQKAVEAYDMVIQRYEEGMEVGVDAFNFANTHKNYIVADKL